jgi:uncharacterized protein with von Willebrand factor type A (vWA) domain
MTTALPTTRTPGKWFFLPGSAVRGREAHLLLRRDDAAPPNHNAFPELAEAAAQFKESPKYKRLFELIGELREADEQVALLAERDQLAEESATSAAMAGGELADSAAIEKAGTESELSDARTHAARLRRAAEQLRSELAAEAQQVAAACVKTIRDGAAAAVDAERAKLLATLGDALDKLAVIEDRKARSMQLNSTTPYEFAGIVPRHIPTANQILQAV